MRVSTQALAPYNGAMFSNDVILSRAQVRRVDALAVEDLRMPSILLMENAGRNAATLIAQRYPLGDGFVTLLCGPGNNGGDGFVIARHLANAGYAVRVLFLGETSRLTDDARTNFNIATHMGFTIDVLDTASACRMAIEELSSSDVLVDALLGTGFHGHVREPLAGAIETVNARLWRGVVSIDVPSGLDCDTGEIGNVAVRADGTVTFVARKRGFENPAAHRYLGEVVVADIGAPPALIERVLTEKES